MYSSDLIQEWKKQRYPSEIVVKIAGRIFPKGGRVLDLGCGGGRNFSYLYDTFDAFGCDVCQELVAHVNNKLPASDTLRILLSTRTSIPFPDNFFDGILAYGILGLNDFQQRSRLYGEIRRVLKPNGSFIMEYTDKNSAIRNRFTNKEIVYELFSEQDIRRELSGVMKSFEIGYEMFSIPPDVIKRWIVYGKIELGALA